MKLFYFHVYKGSYKNAHLLLNILNVLRKAIKCEACQTFYNFFATSLINSIIEENGKWFLFYSVKNVKIMSASM